MQPRGRGLLPAESLRSSSASRFSRWHLRLHILASGARRRGARDDESDGDCARRADLRIRRRFHSQPLPGRSGEGRPCAARCGCAAAGGGRKQQNLKRVRGGRRGGVRAGVCRCRRRTRLRRRRHRHPADVDWRDWLATAGRRDDQRSARGGGGLAERVGAPRREGHHECAHSEREPAVLRAARSSRHAHASRASPRVLPQRPIASQSCGAWRLAEATWWASQRARG